MSLTRHIVADFSTAHDHYQIVETIYRGRPSRVLFTGDQTAAQSGLALDDKPELLFDYIQRFRELASLLKPQHSLLIGGGAFSLPKALNQDTPGINLDVVELDEELLSVAREHFGLALWPELTVYGADGRQFLQQTDKTYDLIMIDAFSQLAIPRSLITQEAISLMADRLSPNGMLVMNAIGSYRGKAAIVLERLSAAYHAAFQNVGIFPAESGLGSYENQNFMVIGSHGDQRLQDYMRYTALPYINGDPDQALHD